MNALEAENLSRPSGWYKTISKAKYNKWIKLICKSAKITEEFEGEPKYLSVSSHTCRRTFCTNAYKSGMNTLDIMQISGYKSEKTYLKYIKATTSDRLEKVRNELFFRYIKLSFFRLNLFLS